MRSSLRSHGVDSRENPGCRDVTAAIAATAVSTTVSTARAGDTTSRAATLNEPPVYSKEGGVNVAKATATMSDAVEIQRPVSVLHPVEFAARSDQPPFRLDAPATVALPHG